MCILPLRFSIFICTDLIKGIKLFSPLLHTLNSEFPMRIVCLSFCKEALADMRELRCYILKADIYFFILSCGFYGHREWLCHQTSECSYAKHTDTC